MTPLDFVLVSALLCALSGIPALFQHCSPVVGRKIAATLTAAASLSGLWGAIAFISGENPVMIYELAWHFPLGPLALRLDPLSAFFLIPVLIVAFSVSLFGCGYFSTSPENRAESFLTFYLGIAVSSIILLLLAANGMTFLVFWELMAISVFLSLCLEHGKPEVREAGLHYLVASHAATISLFILFALLANNGYGDVFPVPGSIASATPLALAILITSLAGFGLKAGIMPLHIWLPTAHANAPSHLSALMSGIVIKMGIYGFVRILSFFSTPPLWWGILFLCLGIVSAVVGVLFAIGQHDIKRLLAYHSIENIGIIVMGIGVALMGLSTGNHILFVLGISSALLHVLNHALFKSLLFLGAGAVIHFIGTREINLMGGVSRALPVTSVAFLTGAVAICGLPPLNGFVSEFLLYLGIFKGFGVSSGTAAAFLAIAAPMLALTGGLALACFVKVYGIVFLGAPRTKQPEGHEHPCMNSSMAILGGFCIIIGALPFLATRLVEPVAASIFPDRNALLPSIQTTAHIYGLSAMAVILLMATVLLTVLYIKRLKSGSIGETGTWDCGYAAPTSTMQYTASSFAGMLIGVFSSILRPEEHPPAITTLFPHRASFRSHVPEVVLDKAIIPLLTAIDHRLASVRRLQSGQLNHYILYIFVAVIVLLALSDFIKH